MGAWGYGLLESDDSQDGLCEVLQGIEADIARLERRRPTEELAARLAAGVGLLLHLQSWYSFNPESEFAQRLPRVLDRHEPMFHALPAGAAQLLQEVRNGKGRELVHRPGRKLSARLQRALFPAESDFPMQRTFSRRDPPLFAHPQSAAYVQEVADRLVKRVDRGFRSRAAIEALFDGEGEPFAALAVLLVIEPCHVDPERFRGWWEKYRAARDDPEEMYESEAECRPCLRLAMEAGIHKFSSGPTRARLKD